MSRNHASLRGWQRFRRQLLDARGWRCERCGLAGKLEIHHKRPLEKGGAAFDEENCEVLCKACHVAHHKRPTSPAAAAWKALVRDLMG